MPAPSTTAPAPGPIEVLTVPEAMAALRIKRGKLYDLIRTKQLTSFTIGRARRITAESIRAFIRRQIEEND
ncbi:helix-turn-helix domain-containing protein [Streptomyces sp. SBT349]|uniref:helix-turn-helix domain-containing protein n=1 Tax=Streptomyces sp. SBT349 TaxID=1580539 RepID=UPI00066A1343|nr:helix-turn-helix domain-containing protein [Streptomyces sp. SBT349]